ncbi:MAG: DNA repair protein RecN, partial [Halofilum sp. (in: g-proteobacteria)]|nr:DNA repair protein RecN [Halofilum sp. (in: g-proteobacteria)]
IIDAVELELGAGMTALTGETGAGKSILLDALGLVLGDRGDAAAIRVGAKRAEITAEFDLAQLPAVAEWLVERELDADGECIVRRTINADGRSRGYVNGRPAAMAVLRELGEQLVDIHGQHEHQSLTRRDAQRDQLDAFGELDGLRAETAEAYQSWRELRERLERLGSDAGTRAERIDLLRYQVQELDALDLGEGELEILESEHRQLANAGHLLETCQQALAILHDEDHSAHNLLARTAHDLESLGEFDARLATARDLVHEALIQCDEAVSSVRDYVENAELDPARLEQVTQRLQAIHDLARKHRVEPEALREHAEALRNELDEYEHAGERAAEVEAELTRAEARYRDAAGRLRQARERAAERLNEQVTAAMHELGMPGGTFVAAVEPRDDGHFSPAGMDRIEYRVSANPGQPPAPLRRVASGGELSRISLAIQLIGSRRTGIATQIFDEVDAGIGGGVAATVGAHLHAVARHRQVLCVTHLAQVAARADHHLQVTKQADADSTRTELHDLAVDERIEEIARMLGGREITERSRAHARELLENA